MNGREPAGPSPPGIRRPATFVATLGGQPQVVTLTLDLLLARGFLVDDVVVIHLAAAGERLRTAVARLDAEFSAGRYAGHPCRYRRETPHLAGRPISDVTGAAEAQAVLRTIRDVVAGLKQGGRTIHLAVAGGRRSMGILSMAVAPLYFDHQDVLWHLYSPEPLITRSRDGALMHLDPGTPPDEAPRLIQIPTVPWGEYLPAVRALTQVDLDPLLRISPPLSPEERRRCREVWSGLSPRPRQVLQALARGQTPAQVAEELCISPATVDSYKTQIYRLCRTAWPDEAGRLDYRFLALKFGPFFEEEARG
ncbi:MAG: CRISPR-associated ring nuclease [Ardenticatenaceae bacterium]|nr:CRISPR-associated ring nuclease [Ardenticatenaceae bacterium]